MNPEEHLARIKTDYQNSAGDSTRLFQTVLAAADEIGWDEALAGLEQCVTEKRLAWLAHNPTARPTTDDWVFEGYRLFYEAYLGVSVPKDGEIVERTRQRIVTRWWNRCPTLEACQKLGLDTREICQKVYHQPVQVILAKINPRLKFSRNYAALRPYCDYCEETISLEE